jgi:hypothetical protein
MEAVKRGDIVILPLSPTPEGVALYPLNDLANTPQWVHEPKSPFVAVSNRNIPQFFGE